MNLSEIAAEEQRLRGELKTVAGNLDINRKEHAALDTRQREILGRIDELEGAALACFQATRGAIAQDPSPPTPLHAGDEDASGAEAAPPACETAPDAPNERLTLGPGVPLEALSPVLGALLGGPPSVYSPQGGVTINAANVITPGIEAVKPWQETAGA